MEQRGESLLKASDTIPLSVIQTEDSPDSIPEGEEDCIIGDGTEECHTSHMEELREQNEHNAHTHAKREAQRRVRVKRAESPQYKCFQSASFFTFLPNSS